jgi:orotate phosphoribosyltransferase
MFNYGVYPDTEKNLAGAGLSVHALTDWSTTLDVAESREYFTPEQVKVVRAFLNDPSGWSKSHGGVAG